MEIKKQFANILTALMDPFLSFSGAPFPGVLNFQSTHTRHAIFTRNFQWPCAVETKVNSTRRRASKCFAKLRELFTRCDVWLFGFDFDAINKFRGKMSVNCDVKIIMNYD